MLLVNKTLVVVSGIVLLIVLEIGFAYGAWVNYLSFHDSVLRGFWDSSSFNNMVFLLLLFGFLTGAFVGMVLFARSNLKETQKKQERKRLKEEIKKELETKRKKKEATAQG